MSKKVFVISALAGLPLTIVGVFAGLQISSALGNLLSFPIILLVMITGEPFGMWSEGLLIISALFVMLCWGVVGSLLYHLFCYLKA